MLRNKAAVSDIKDFTEVKFRSVLEEPTYEEGTGDRSKVTRILLVVVFTNIGSAVGTFVAIPLMLRVMH